MNGHGSALVFSKNTIRELLSQILSPDKETREAAEENFESMNVFNELGIYLIQIVVDVNCSSAVRQLAAKRLREYTATQLSESTKAAKPITSEIKDKIIIWSLLSLRESNRKIRGDVASAISIIANPDFLKNSPGLIDILLTYLRGRNKFAVVGALWVLTDLEFHEDARLSEILKETYRIFEAEDQYFVKTQTVAVAVFMQIVSGCSVRFAEKYFQSLASMFCRRFIEHLRVQNDVSDDSYHLKTEIIRAITPVMETFPKCISEFFPEILPLIWKILIDSAKAYEGEAVNVGTDIENTRTDCDGRLIDELINLILELIHDIMMNEPNVTRAWNSSHSEYIHQDYHWYSLKDYSLSSSEVLHYLIYFMKITDKEITFWTNDPVKFFRHEDSLSCSTCLRGLTREIVLVEGVLMNPRSAAANAMVVEILKQMERECMMRVNSNSEISQNQWKLHEAFLLAFCLAKEIIATQLDEGTLEFDFIAFLKNVIIVDVNNSESHPLLKSRCLLFGGLYVEQIPPELAPCFLTATVNALQDQSPFLKICAAIAAKDWLQATTTGGNEDFKELVKSFLPALFEGIFNLHGQLKIKNLMNYIIKNVHLMVLIHKAFTDSVLDKVCVLTIAAYNESNYETRTSCDFCLNEVTLNPKYTGMIERSLVPRLVKGYSGSSNTADILVRNSPQPLSKLLIGILFPALCQNILSKFTSLVNGGKVICTYLAVAAQQVISYRDKNGKTGQQYILQVAARVSNDKYSDRGPSVAHEIVTLLLRHAGNVLSIAVSDLQYLLKALPSKVEITEKKSILRRSFLLVWAQLINTHIDPVLKFLTEMYCSGNVGAAQTSEIFHGFCGDYPFFENDESKTVTQALCKILEHGITHKKSWLHHIVIEATQEDQTTTIPLLVQICELIKIHVSKQIEELEKGPDSGGTLVNGKVILCPEFELAFHMISCSKFRPIFHFWCLKLVLMPKWE